MYSKTYSETFVKTLDAITPIYLMDQTWLCVYYWWQTLEGVISPNNLATIRRRKWSEPFSWKIWTYLFHIVNIISDYGLVIQGTMTSLMDNMHQVSDDSLLHQSHCLGQWRCIIASPGDNVLKQSYAIKGTCSTPTYPAHNTWCYVVGVLWTPYTASARPVLC